MKITTLPFIYRGEVISARQKNGEPPLKYDCISECAVHSTEADSPGVGKRFSCGTFSILLCPLTDSPAPPSVDCWWCGRNFGLVRSIFRTSPQQVLRYHLQSYVLTLTVVCVKV